PSRIGNLLDMTMKDLEKVLYCEAYVVIDPGSTPFTMGEILTEEKFQKALDDYGEESFIAGMGAEAVRELLRQLERGPTNDGRGLEHLARQLRAEVEGATSEAKRKKLGK